jgi:1-acyl-sn-glycerol-3-phosphate acyltransferase
MRLLSRVVFWMVRHSIFKVRVVGQRNAPHRGPASLAANHVTYATDS